MFNTIVVGTDGSPHGQHAVAVAADLAAALQARVVLVHIEEPFPPPLASASGYVPYVPQTVIDEVEASTRQRVETEFCAPLRAASVAYETRILHGSPATKLRETATEVGADLIVVGTRALHALGELFLGSTSHALTLHAPVPVVVVPLVPAVKPKEHEQQEAALTV